MTRAISIGFLTFVWCFTGCSSHPNAPEGGCVHDQKLPPLHLTTEQKQLLSTVSSTPKTALDFYMLLPKSSFDIMPDSAKRRISYVKLDTLTDGFLHASRSFECNGGGFEVTLKLYHSPATTFVAIIQSVEIKDVEEGTVEKPEILIVRPSLWRYVNKRWQRKPDEAIPEISPQQVLKKYHRDQDADRKNTDPSNIIYIDYDLSPSTDDIILKGRGNFQRCIYEYARLHWDGERFILSPTNR